MVTYADSALKQLRDACKDYGFELKDLTESKVSANVTLNSITTEVWFDVDRQLFAFKLFQGGAKSFQGIEAFKGVFYNYMHCYGVLKPKASHIVSFFEKEYNIQTIFNTISGNAQNGFKAIYCQVGAENEIHVYEVDGNYRADYIEYNCDKTASSTIATRLYSDDFEEVLTLDFYLENLMKLYTKPVNGLELLKIGSEDYKLKWMSTECVVRFIVEDSIVTVNIKSAVSDNFKLESSSLLAELQNPYDLMEIVRRVEEYKSEEINRHKAEAEVETNNDVLEESTMSNDIEESNENTQTIETSSEETSSIDDSSDAEESSNDEDSDAEGTSNDKESDVEDSSNDKESDVEESSIDEESLEEDFTSENESDSEDSSVSEDFIESQESEDTQDCEDTKECEDNQESEDAQVSENTQECEDIQDENNDSESEEENKETIEEHSSLLEESEDNLSMELKAIKENGSIVGVLLRDDNVLYTFSVDTAYEAGIPVKRLDYETNLVLFRGIRVTEDEKELKKFAIDLNGELDKLSSLLDVFFDE